MSDEQVYIWAVEQGSYSDYQVVAVFDSEDAAEACAAARNLSNGYERATVAKWPLLSKAPKRIPIHYYEMWPTTGIREWMEDAWSNEIDEEPDEYDERVHMWSNGGVQSRARTADEARKAAHDALAEAVVMTQHPRSLDGSAIQGLQVVTARRTISLLVNPWP